MGTTRTDYFSEKQNRTATVLKALGHPARIAILEYLMKVDSCICGDLVNELPLAQPTVSQHLKALKEAGIIKGSIDGNSVCYCIDEKVIDRIRTYFEGCSQKLKSNKQQCC